MALAPHGREIRVLLDGKVSESRGKARVRVPSLPLLYAPASLAFGGTDSKPVSVFRRRRGGNARQWGCRRTSRPAGATRAAHLSRRARSPARQRPHGRVHADRFATARVDELRATCRPEMLAEVAPRPAEQPRFFTCGPTPFVEAVAEALVRLGHEPRAIKTERFGPTGR